MGSSEVHGHATGCQGLVPGRRQEPVLAALPIPPLQGSAARGGRLHPPARRVGLGRADASTPAERWVQAGMDKPSRRERTDLSSFALSTAVFILRGPVPSGRFHFSRGSWAYQGSPKATRAAGPAQRCLARERVR